MNLPNKLSISRIIVTVLLYVGLFITSLLISDFSTIVSFGPEEAPINLLYLIVCIVFILASLTDMLDGKIARKYNLVTDLGKFLDPVADKMLVNATLIFLTIQVEGQLSISVYIVIVFIVRDLIVDAFRLIASTKKIVLAANIFGKLKTVAQMVAIPLILLNGFPFSFFDYNFPKGLRIAEIFVYIALFFSVLSGIIYLVSNWKRVFSKEKSIQDNVKRLFNILDKKGYTISSVESFTGGLFGASLTSISGSSKYYKGSIVSYCEEIKENIVGVSENTISKFTVVSKEVALEMAKNGKNKLNTNICVSFTGNAGPTVDKGGKPLGKVFIGFIINDDVFVKEFDFAEERNIIREKAVNLALEEIINNLEKNC